MNETPTSFDFTRFSADVLLLAHRPTLCSATVSSSPLIGDSPAAALLSTT